MSSRTLLRVCLNAAAMLGSVPLIAQQPVALEQLTLATDRSTACAIGGPASIGIPGVKTNPWRGTDAAILAVIRERMEGTPQVPDALPLTRSGAARYRLRWAEGIEEGYAAIYEDAAGEWVVVHAVLPSAGASEVPGAPARSEGRAARFDIGRIVAFVYGSGPCFEAVEAHLKTLLR